MRSSLSPEDGPGTHELEISLFGPGFGESILVHLGQGAWLVVDSCVPSGFKEPAPLTYLRNIGVDPASAVRFVVATHMDDDHIRGLGKTVSECKAARLVCAAALGLKEFFEIVCFDDRFRMSKATSGIHEFRMALRALADRNWPLKEPRFVKARSRIFSSDTLQASDAVTVDALSPSDEQFRGSQQHLGKWFPSELEPQRQIPGLKRNDLAIVLLISMGRGSVLLGADLEERGQPGRGWSAVLGDWPPQVRPSVFKVPHHGSANADHPDIWQTVLVPEPFAILSPWRLGGRELPTANDIERICARTPHAFVTARLVAGRSARREQSVERKIRETVGALRVVNRWHGHIRLRKASLQNEAPWSVGLFGDARPLRGR